MHGGGSGRSPLGGGHGGEGVARGREALAGQSKGSYVCATCIVTFRLSTLWNGRCRSAADVMGAGMWEQLLLEAQGGFGNGMT